MSGHYFQGRSLRVTVYENGKVLELEFKRHVGVGESRFYLTCQHWGTLCNFTLEVQPHFPSGFLVTEQQHDTMCRHVLKHGPEKSPRVVASEPKPFYPATGGGGAGNSSSSFGSAMGPSGMGYFTRMFMNLEPPGPPKPPPVRYTMDFDVPCTEGEFKGWAEKRGGIMQPIAGYEQEARREFTKLCTKTPATTTHDAIYRARQLFFGRLIEDPIAPGFKRPVRAPGQDGLIYECKTCGGHMAIANMSLKIAQESGLVMVLLERMALIHGKESH